jgi:hypothetical protein
LKNLRSRSIKASVTASFEVRDLTIVMYHSTLNSSLLNDELSESNTVHQQTISNRLLGASGWRGTNSPTPTASQRWFTLAEIQ